MNPHPNDDAQQWLSWKLNIVNIELTDVAAAVQRLLSEREILRDALIQLAGCGSFERPDGTKWMIGARAQTALERADKLYPAEPRGASCTSSK